MDEFKAKYVFGLKGFASLFGCTTQTAYNWKKSGKFDSAIYQHGRKIVVDVEEALKIASRNNKFNLKKRGNHEP